MEVRHEPVLLQEVLQWMNVREDGVYLETEEFGRHFGNSRHAERVLSREGRDGTHRENAVHRHRLDVGLDAGASA